MRTLIFSDIHDNLASLERLLALRADLAVQRLVCLGDVGRHPYLFELLAEEQIDCTFGNWEVSGLERMAPDLAATVGAWPATLHQGDALFCHATPDMQPDWATTQAVVEIRRAQRTSWHTFFPRLDRDDDARWSAFAALEMADVRVAFHGHTHVQLAWGWLPGESGKRSLHRLPPKAPITPIPIGPGTADAPARYLIGVGSLGAPEDGPWPRFAVWDDEARVVELHRVVGG